MRIPMIARSYFNLMPRSVPIQSDRAHARGLAAAEEVTSHI